MGREVRRVPANWEHPKVERPDHRLQRMVMDYQPMYDCPFGPAMDEWYAGWKAWERGERPDYASDESKDLPFWEWEGSPPDPAYYRPDWKEGEATWYQVYQTVSEGSPVTPPFATQAELVDYLVANGDFWDQKRGDGGWSRENAESFVGDGWAPSLIGAAGSLHAPRDGNPLTTATDTEVVT